MNPHFRRNVLPSILLATSLVLPGCATPGKPPPVIFLDEPVAVAAKVWPESVAPVEVAAAPAPAPSPMPEQTKALPVDGEAAAPEPADDKVRVSRANDEARVPPTREGYVNAIQVWP